MPIRARHWIEAGQGNPDLADPAPIVFPLLIYPKGGTANPPSRHRCSASAVPSAPSRSPRALWQPEPRGQDRERGQSKREAARSRSTADLAPGALQVPDDVVPDSDDLASAAARTRRHRVRPKPRHAAVAHPAACLANEFGNGSKPHAKGGPSSGESVVQLQAPQATRNRASAKVAHGGRGAWRREAERPTPAAPQLRGPPPSFGRRRGRSSSRPELRTPARCDR
jgi:hypothetical protein